MVSIKSAALSLDNKRTEIQKIMCDDGWELNLKQCTWKQRLQTMLHATLLRAAAFT